MQRSAFSIALLACGLAASVSFADTQPVPESEAQSPAKTHHQPMTESTAPTHQNEKSLPGTGKQNPGAARSATQSTSKVDLNKADEAMLVKELKVNKGDAEAIVNHRKVEGPYKSVDDLKKVAGLKPDTIERISGMVQYENSAAGAPGMAPPDKGTKQDPGAATGAGGMKEPGVGGASGGM